ncbi:MAG: hypothetical protein JWO06_3917 [Bacteroidota bacterium]|nr:hypothetical protein [Bacteroidota bacterium]
MKKLALLFAVAAGLTACNNNNAPVVDTAKEQQALLVVDHDFCAMEQQQGMGKAMDKFYDQDVIGISPNQPVGVGKAAIMKLVADSKMDGMNSLDWKAEKAVVSSSGDLGYVWGRYTVKTKTKEGADTTVYGAYSTIYKKTTDGWKAVVDQNNDTPKP